MKTIKRFHILILILLSWQVNAQNYELVWSDEFEGTEAVDATKWSFESGGDIRNSELQYYTSNTANVRQNNGNLEITVLKEQVGGKQYTSGSIITLGHNDWVYGKIEGRFKMPVGQGLWPCFWMQGSNAPSVDWPACGEIDIFEHISSENSIHANAHWADTNDEHDDNSGTFDGIDVTQWHVYSIIWDAANITYFVDDVQYHQVPILNGINGTNEFHAPQYLLINLPIGGTWPGSPDASTVLPATMYCDYVRVYRDTELSTAVTGVVLNPSVVELGVGGTYQLAAMVYPNNASNKDVSYNSSNTAVATVSNTGVVTGVSAGSCSITVTSNDGNFQSSTSVTISAGGLGSNRAENPGFEDDNATTQSPTGWMEWSSVDTYSAGRVVTGRAHSGNYSLFHQGATAYDIFSFQRLTGLTNGSYTCRAWVKSSGGQSAAAMYVKGFGGAGDMQQSLKTEISDWTLVEIRDIPVTNNSCEFGFYSYSSGGDWLEVDDVRFIPTPTGPPTAVDDLRTKDCKVYPNPIQQNSELNFEFSGQTSGKVSVIITDLSGKAVMHKTIDLVGTHAKVPLLNIPKGVYVVQLKSQNISILDKIIVQ